jgi:AraC family transcriptional activator FtrA
VHRVAILTYDGVALFELGCAVELFGLPRPELKNWYECEVVSFSHGPFSTTAGVQLITKFIKNLRNYNLLIIHRFSRYESILNK